MAEQSKMVERYMERRKEIFRAAHLEHRTVPSPDRFEKHLRDGLHQLIQWVAGRARNGDQSFLVPERVWEQFTGQHTDGKKLLDGYKAAFNQYQSVRDAKREEFWAAFKDRTQAFAFRMATGIGIAAIILATGWLAQHWNIPIPLLRIVP